MGEKELNILTEVAKQTDSGLLLFFIIVVVAMVVVLLPLYTLITKDRRYQKKDEYNRTQQMINVITANTEVISGLKITLEKFGVDTSSSIARLHTRIDDICEELTDMYSELKIIHNKMDGLK